MQQSADNYTALERLFYQGRSAEVLASTVDQPFAQVTFELWPLVIGALAFLGRADEAEWRFQTLEKDLSIEQAVSCRFYLGVGFTRASHYTKATQYFITNLRTLRQSHPTPRMAFYVWQGVGFFHHFRGRYLRALQAGEKALEAAVRSDFFFGRMLATDLVAHARVESGEIARGLSELEMAHRLAHRLGHGSYEKAIYRAIVCYRAQYGLSPQDTLNSLRELIQEAKIQDVYTDNYLSLELARQLTIRGQLHEAEGCLQNASRSIYATQHRRQRVLLNLRKAEIAFLRREENLVWEKLQLALADIDPLVDLPLHLHWLGLALKAQWPGLTQGRELIGRLSKKVGSGWARRIAARNGLAAQHPFAPADDPLGDLLDEIKSSPQQIDAGRLINQSYLGLLAPLLPVSATTRVIYLHLAPKALLVYDRGDLRLLESGHSPKLLDLLRALAKGLRSKAELVTAVWDYTYHPLRHDTLLYTLISRLRSALGNSADWLENTSEGYQLASGVSVIMPKTLPLPERPEGPSLEPAAEEPRLAELNARQIGILQHLRHHPWIGIETCSSLFQTSKVTATRDLSALVKAGLILRKGKGRATLYGALKSDS